MSKFREAWKIGDAYGERDLEKCRSIVQGHKKGWYNKKYMQEAPNSWKYGRRNKGHFRLLEITA